MFPMYVLSQAPPPPSHFEEPPIFSTPVGNPALGKGFSQIGSQEDVWQNYVYVFLPSLL